MTVVMQAETPIASRTGQVHRRLPGCGTRVATNGQSCCGMSCNIQPRQSRSDGIRGAARRTTHQHVAARKPKANTARLWPTGSLPGKWRAQAAR